MPQFEEWEINKYWEIFQGLSPINGLLTGDQCAPVLKNSQLSEPQLERIWDLSDIDGDGSLDFEEFCIAMRLIFDLINGNSASLPPQLPEWLVPASKAHIVAANRALGGTDHSVQTSRAQLDLDPDDDLGLSSDFDWYIGPEDRSQYNTIYSANSDRRGLIAFDSLTELYSTLAVPETEVSSAWNLVNPRSDEKIDKDQCIVFLHILNQRSRGVRVPRSVPASLRATFEKARPEYDLNSKQSVVNRPAESSRSSGPKAFADGYLTRLGLGGRSSGYQSAGTDFSSTDNTDWEEVRLKRQLADLERQVQAAEEAAERRKKGVEDFGASRAGLVRRELDQLLQYKETQLQKLRRGDLKSSGTSLAGVDQDVDLVVQQIESLRQHEQRRRDELEALNQEIAQLS